MAGPATSQPIPTANPQPTAQEWEFLYKNDIPFKHQLHHFFWHFPGILCAVVIGIVTNMLLEEILKKFSKRVAEHTLVTLTWVGLIIYLVFFTNFDHWVARKISWHKIVPPPVGTFRGR
jgi:hypothetical protein